MIVSMNYGREIVSAPLPWAGDVVTLAPAHCPPLPDITDALEKSLEQPIGIGTPLAHCFKRGDSVAVVVSDGSRKTGMEQALPRLIAWLGDCGISEDRINFLIATGVHRPATEAEQERILGGVLMERFGGRIHNHDAHTADDLVHVGATRRGTAVLLNRRALECDHLILTGTVAPHYFAGFGGGRKALAPGLAGAATIAQNHVLSIHPTEARLDAGVRICVLDGNPVAEDLLEAARMRPPAFIVNTVLGRDGAIVGLFAGEMDAAHRAACALAAKIYAAPLSSQADVVIAASPSAPNFVQCHKALFNAYNAVKPDGRIILIAPAREGLGGDGFRRFLNMGEPALVAASVRRAPDINGQTALSTLEKARRALLVTELSGDEVGLLGAEKSASLADALARVRDEFAARGIDAPRCVLMPDAANTVPVLTSQASYTKG